MRPVLVAAAISALGAGAGAGLVGGRAAIHAGVPERYMAQGPWRASNWSTPASDIVSAALRRAVRAETEPAALPPSDLIVFTSERDADGRSFSGASNYVLQFALRNLPPVDDFWSVSVIASDGAAAPDAGPSVSSRSATLRRNRDGSLDVQIGASPPDDPTANWLATPSGAFQLVLRAYTPAASLREGRWQPPAVIRRESAA